MPKSVLRAVLGRMQFTLHATGLTSHGASHLVQAMSAWLVKTRRAPSRYNSRDARVCGHTTTAMHKLSTPPPPRPPSRSHGCPTPHPKVPLECCFQKYAWLRGDVIPLPSTVAAVGGTRGLESVTIGDTLRCLFPY